jgi:hemolysin activation/secretion protein
MPTGAGEILRNARSPVSRGGFRALWVGLLLCGGWWIGPCGAAVPLGEPLPEPPTLPWEERANWAAAEEEDPRLFVAEYRVQGSTKLDANEIGRAVYPYLGEERTLEDLEGARMALEKAFHQKGYQSVTVELPQQRGRGGVVYLRVMENKVGRLRVTGSRFFDIEKVRRRARSLREGEVPNFEEVQREILALNRHPDRRVIPTLRPGAEAGTIDVDLEIQDTFPFHGAVELNNRYSPNTTPLRLDLSARYTNLWQEGHTVGFGFQIAPENPDDATIFTGFYLLPVPGADNLSFMLTGTQQNSDVSTLGGSASAGNGTIVGARLIYTLPMGEGFFHSLSFGWDYKNFKQDLTLVEGEDPLQAPVTYYPFSLAYTASWIGEGYQTELAGSLNWLFRGWGSSVEDFDTRRFGSDGGYLYFRGNVSHARTLPYGFQIFGEVQGQLANQPLVDSEQFSGGGLYTVRGYLESVVLGDSAIATTVELRSPDFLKWLGKGNEGRVYGFVDAGYWELIDPLPEQDFQFTLVGVGFGTRLKFMDFLNGSVDVGSPMITQGPSQANSLLLTFRAWADF